MLLFSICEHRADVPWQKVQFWSHLSTGHSPRRFVACQHVVWHTPVWLFYDLFSTMVYSLVVSHVAHFGSKSDEWCTDFSCAWSSAWISLEVFLGFFCYHLDYPSLWSVINFLLRPRPGRLATVPWILNFWITCATVVTGTSSCSEMVLYHLPLTCLSMIIFLISWDKSFFCFLWSMLSLVHTMSQNNAVITWSPIYMPTDWLQDYRHLWCWLVDTPWINMPLWSHYFHSFLGVPSFLSRPVSCIYFFK